MTKKPTALRLFKQQQKIKELKDKLWVEEDRLKEMIKETQFISELVNVNGRVYLVRSIPGQRTFYNRLEVEFIGDCQEVAKVFG